MSSKKSLKRKRNRYSNEFKSEAVKLCKSKGISEVSKDLGVSSDSLQLWVRKNIQAEGRSNEELLKENNNLRKENACLKKINEVLKKLP